MKPVSIKAPSAPVMRTNLPATTAAVVPIAVNTASIAIPGGPALTKPCANEKNIGPIFCVIVASALNPNPRVRNCPPTKNAEVPTSLNVDASPVIAPLAPPASKAASLNAPATFLSTPGAALPSSFMCFCAVSTPSFLASNSSSFEALLERSTSAFTLANRGLRPSNSDCSLTTTLKSPFFLALSMSLLSLASLLSSSLKSALNSALIDIFLLAIASIDAVIPDKSFLNCSTCSIFNLIVVVLFPSRCASSRALRNSDRILSVSISTLGFILTACPSSLAFRNST